MQYEGVVDEPAGAELKRLKDVYFETFPDGQDRQGWPGITYVRSSPTWIRYSDFNQEPPETIEFNAAELRGGAG